MTRSCQKSGSLVGYPSVEQPNLYKLNKGLGVGGKAGEAWVLGLISFEFRM